MKELLLILFPVMLFLSACEKNGLACIDCDQKAIISETQFKNAPSDPVTILGAEIQGDCLWIKFASSGCSGDTWKVKLVASEMEYFSIPPQRDVRLSLENMEMCEAYFTKEMTFDIKDLKRTGNAVQLNIVNSELSLMYR